MVGILFLNNMKKMNTINTTVKYTNSYCALQNTFTKYKPKFGRYYNNSINALTNVACTEAIKNKFLRYK